MLLNGILAPQVVLSARLTLQPALCGTGLSSGQAGKLWHCSPCSALQLSRTILLQACTSATVRGMSLAVVATMASAKQQQHTDNSSQRITCRPHKLC
jgi:hypothetical protein